MICKVIGSHDDDQGREKTLNDSFACNVIWKTPPEGRPQLDFEPCYHGMMTIFFDVGIPCFESICEGNPPPLLSLTSFLLGVWRLFLSRWTTCKEYWSRAKTSSHPWQEKECWGFFLFNSFLIFLLLANWKSRWEIQWDLLVCHLWGTVYKFGCEISNFNLCVVIIQEDEASSHTFSQGLTGIAIEPLLPSWEMTIIIWSWETDSLPEKNVCIWKITVDGCTEIIT